MAKKRSLKSSEVPVKKVKKSIEPKVTEKPVDLENKLFHLRYSFGGEYTCERHLFLKKDLSTPCSIIVSNVPAYIPEGIVASFIGQYVPHEIQEIEVQRSNANDGQTSSGQLTMAVRFDNEEAVKEALLQASQVGPYTVSDFTPIDSIRSVLQDAITLYPRLFPTEDQIEAAASAYMEKYDEAQEEMKAQNKKRYSEPDEEGWITVNKSKKSIKAVKLKKSEIPLMGGIPIGKKKAKKNDVAFYNYQVKESKIKKAAELLKKFEEDKKRVAQLKQARNFKPA